ncbi:ferredoxin [Pseudonocardia abyssalis]|uniref:Ferredoxin family protein n=1 Tax=Pseudonocardia abyssalis TaxID=2792008 RepID=A0ABS6UYW2_9PSEU|nr:ferredoxin [Pseudonocardia abyssalis]MBW0115751.1 ferredoxin family protein [Pseudonocardia abyssalis]MBW0137424.1 ferredoxin family protein [Pseudonocardia abyssalis]
MPFVIGGTCIDETDRSCVDECPVDCIYEGERKLYINPAECIDCGNCEPACPVSAIFNDRLPVAGQDQHVADNAAFFSELLPGLTSPLGMPGGAALLGPLGVDTTLVRAHP